MADGIRRAFSRLDAGSEVVLAHAGRRAESLARRTWVRALGRVHVVVAGLVEAAIGLTAILFAAAGRSEGAADAGPLTLWQASPLGAVLLWGCVGGSLAVALWLLIDALAARTRVGGVAGLRALWRRFGSAAVQLLVCVAVLGALTWSSDDGVQPGGAASPGVQAGLDAAVVVLLGALAAIVGIVGIVLALRSGRRHAADDPDRRAGRADSRLVAVRRVGAVARGTALVAIGALCVVAVVTLESDVPSGPGGTLLRLASEPAGAVLLGLVGLGLVTAGVCTVLRARHAGSRYATR